MPDVRESLQEVMHRREALNGSNGENGHSPDINRTPCLTTCGEPAVRRTRAMAARSAQLAAFAWAAEHGERCECDWHPFDPKEIAV